VLQTLGQLDFRTEDFIKRQLFNTFHAHFEQICGNLARVQNEESTLMQFAKALTDWSNLSFVSEPRYSFAAFSFHFFFSDPQTNTIL